MLEIILKTAKIPIYSFPCILVKYAISQKDRQIGDADLTRSKFFFVWTIVNLRDCVAMLDLGRTRL